MKSTATYRASGNQAYWPLSQFSPSESSARAAKPKLKVRLQNLLNRFVDQLTAYDEPRIWQSHDATGNTLWNAYDSRSNRLLRDASENDLRIWLETRYRF